MLARHVVDELHHGNRDITTVARAYLASQDECDENRKSLAAAVQVAEHVQMLIQMILHERENGPTKRGMDTSIWMARAAVKSFASALAGEAPAAPSGADG